MRRHHQRAGRTASLGGPSAGVNHHSCKSNLNRHAPSSCECFALFARPRAWTRARVCRGARHDRVRPPGADRRARQRVGQSPVGRWRVRYSRPHLGGGHHRVPLRAQGVRGRPLARAHGEYRGGLYGYVGTYGDLSYKRIYFTPQIAMGGYHDGDSADLGGVFQFRVSLDVAYRFDNGHRVGVRAAHISNGGVNEQNRARRSCS